MGLSLRGEGGRGGGGINLGWGRGSLVGRRPVCGSPRARIDVMKHGCIALRAAASATSKIECKMSDFVVTE